jgi:hypothetical protein
MRKMLLIPLIGVLFLAASCTDREKTGCDVMLLVEWTGTVQIYYNIAAGLPPTINTFILYNKMKDPGAAASTLNDVQTSRYHVKWTRADDGTAAPQDFDEALSVRIPAGSTTTVNNLPLMLLSQMAELPLINLLPENGGLDPETGKNTIVCTAETQFFGRTTNGCDLSSDKLNLFITFYYAPLGR